MTEPARSIPEVVETLVQEFDGAFSARSVTNVVKRLSVNGAMSLPALTETARNELTTMLSDSPRS